MEKYLKTFERTLFILVIVLLVFIPLFPKLPVFNIGGTFVAIRLEDFLVALTLGLWGTYIYFSGRFKEVLKDKLILAILVFFFVGMISTFSAIFVTHTVGFKLSIFHFLRRIEILLLLPVVITTVRSLKQVKIALITLGVVVMLVNIYALGQQYLNWKVISTTNSEFSKGQILELTPGGRVNSTFAGHYDLAVFLMMVLTIVAALIFSTKNVFLNGYYMVAGALSAFVLVLTAARFSFFGAILGVISALILTKKKYLILLTLILAVAALAYPSQLRERLLSTVKINLLNKTGQTYETKQEKVTNKLNIANLPTYSSNSASLSAFTNTTESSIAADIVPGEPTDPTELGVYRSFAIRLNVEWPRAINAFYRNPLLGSGYSSIGVATDNDYLRSLGEVGIFGTFAFVLIMVEICKRVYKNFRSKVKFVKYFSAGVLACIFAFLLNAIFIDVFEASKVATLFWMLIGLNLGLFSAEEKG